MIDVFSHSTAASFNERLVNALNSALTRSQHLRTTALACIDNFKWLSATDRRHLILLDFDVVFGALAQIRSNHSSASPERYEFPWSPVMLLGETATTYLLSLVNVYSLPPGSTAELLRHYEHLNHSLTSGANRFLQRAHQLQVESDKAAVYGNPGAQSDLRELLLEDTYDLIDNFRDTLFLKRIYEQAQPIQKYIEASPPTSEEPLRILRDSYFFLKHVRPTYRKHKNNFYDAMNAATVATLLASTKKDAPIPILITQTRPILSYENTSAFHELLSTYQTKIPFKLSNDPMFLLVFETLLNRTEQRYLPAADSAHQLMIDAERFGSSAEELLHYCVMKGDRVQSVQDLPRSGWEMMLFSHEIFSYRWSKLFEPLQFAAKRDLAEAVQFMNTRPSFQTDGVIAQLKNEDQIAGLVSELSSSEPLGGELWELAVKFSSVSGDYSSLYLSAAENMPFSISWSLSSGDLLRATSRGQALDQMDPQLVRSTHSLEINVIPTIRGSGSVLRIVSFKDLSISPTRYLRIVWLHALSSRDAAERCWQLLKIASNENELSSASLYSDAGVKAIHLEDKFDGTLDGCELETSDVVEFQRGFSRSFADLRPIDDVECQMSITASERYMGIKAVERIAELIDVSSATTLPSPIGRELLRNCMKALFVTMERGK